MAEYTLIKIDQLPDGTANLSSKVMFGIGDKIHTTTVEQLLSLFVENNSITPREVFVPLLVTNSNFTTILMNVNLTISQNEIVFLKFNALFGNRATLNTYLVPLGAGIYNPLGTEIALQNLILINEQPLDDIESDTNTVTYTVDDLNEINDAVVPFDFSDETKVYFIIFAGSLYRFVGTLGLYGDGELQMDENDIELISTQAMGDFIQKTYFDYGRITAPTRDLIFDGRTNFWFNTTLPVFKGFNGSVEMFRGKRFIIRNLWTEDTLLESDDTVEFTFFENYILKAGESLEFDLFQAKLRLVGVDAIPRKGTANGAPITGDLKFDSSKAVSLKHFTGDNLKEILFGDDGVLILRVVNEDEDILQEIEFGIDAINVRGLLRNVIEQSEDNLNQTNIYAQRSYILGVPKSTSFTAQANGRYRTTATLTITDPASGNYFVMVESGVCTIGGVNYVAGDWVWRVGSTNYKINGGGVGGGTWGGITGDLPDQEDLQTALDAKLDKAPTESTSTEITFTSRRIHGSFGTPLTNATFTTSLTNAILNLEQKAYHQAGTEPDYPIGFVKVGGGQYIPNAKNIIFFEWAGGTRVEFSIIPA